MKHRDRLIIHDAEVKEDGLDVQGELPASVLDISSDESDRQYCPNPLAYQLHIQRVSHGLLAQGEVSTTVRCRCDRCLKYYDFELKSDDVCHFVEELHDNIADFTDDIREDLIINLPSRNLCQEDCQGICPSCGQNLNVRQCDCPEDDSGSDAWHQLDNLNL